MSKENKISEIEIDKFFDGGLTKERRLHFDEKMATDAWFARKVREHHQIRKDLTIQGDRIRIIEVMEEVHLKEFGGIPYLKKKPVLEEVEQGEDPALSDIPTVKSTKVETRGRFVSIKTFYAGIGIAASISVLITLGSIWFANKNEYQEKGANLGYQDLVKEEGVEVKDTNSDLKKIRSIDKSNPEASVKYLATAFAIAKDGYFITNNHVVQGCKRLRLKVKNPTGGWLEFNAKVLLQDTLSDLSMVQIDDTNFRELGILPFTFSNERVMMGQDVYTLGYPKKDIVMEPGTLSSTTGLMGDTTAYQLAMSLNSGNSGGPIFNTKGEIIAVVKGKHNGKEGTGYAVRADYMIDLIEKYESENNIVLKKPKYNQIQYKSRVKQISHIRQFVFLVEAEK